MLSLLLQFQSRHIKIIFIKYYDFQLAYFNLTATIFHSQMADKMMAPILLLFLWTTASGFALQDTTHLQGSAVNFGGTKKLIGYFDDQGDGATKQQTITFENAINSASSFYRNDDQKRLKYIADQMDKAYSQSDKKFQIHQNGLRMAQYHLFVDVDETFSSAPVGSDKIFPNKTYMFNRISTAGKTPYFIPINGSKGSGITPEIEAKLISLITAADDDDECICGNAIWGLYSPLSAWSFLCFPDPTDAMCYAYVVKEQYYSAKGKNCYFALWRGE